jgi:tellurite resistance protein
MSERNATVLRAAICVAWADGVMKDAERRSIEGILAAADLTAGEKADVRIYAATPRTLQDLDKLDIAGFTPGERRSALLHAVAIAFADKEYEHAERQTVVALAQRLGLASSEAHQIIANAMMRVGGR